MPEGDSIHRAAERLRVLEGEVLAVESPHPRAAALGVAGRLDGKRLERVEAVGKNLLLSFEGGVVLRSHLRMKGRWQVRSADAPPGGRPWLVLRGRTRQAVLWHGPVLELHRGRAASAIANLGPDIMVDSPDFDRMVGRLRTADQGRQIGEALLDQRLVAGIGNMWRSEALFLAGCDPWRPLDELADDELRGSLEAAAAAMREGRRDRFVYRRSGLPCRRCGTKIRSRPQGDAARTVYWCPACQAGTAAASA
jgi:endonuclease-8